MLVSQKLAIAAHLHVMLRRKTGRVTDTEWMAANLEYALEIIRFTRAKADEDGHHELHEWADKLEKAVLEPTKVHRPLAQTAMQLLKERERQGPPSVPSGPSSQGFGHSIFGDTAPAPDPAAPRYVGGIR